MTALNLTRNHRSGFALVSAVSVLALLLLIGLAILSLSTSTTREAKVDRHAEIARANARMALSIAIAQLQEAMGPDQRVSATADILADSNAPLPGREKWLGAWKTTYEVESGQESPMVGKAGIGGGGAYSSDAYYEDLRHTNADLQGGKWKDKLHYSWLASGGVDAQTPFSGDKLEILSARGQEEAVEVGLVPVAGSDGEKGNYAWWISDNNMKASLGGTFDPEKAEGLTLAPYAEPAALDPLDAAGIGSDFENITEDPAVMARYASYSTIQLANKSPQMKEALKNSYHDLTVRSFGLPVDTAYGGLKKDLTPLIQGGELSETLTFNSPSQDSVFPSIFNSDAPIIPGERHAVVGPKFASMRHWAKFSMANPGDVQAETTSLTGNGAIQMRDSEGWEWATEENGFNPNHRTNVHQIKTDGQPISRGYEKSDGMYFSEENWASSSPKFHPVMTDVRWHYYFDFGVSGGGKDIDPEQEGTMGHIIPRVCLWNPYSRPMTFNDMVVVMPNVMASTRDLGMGYSFHPYATQAIRKEAYAKFKPLDDMGKNNLTPQQLLDYEMYGALTFFNGTVQPPLHKNAHNSQWPHLNGDEGGGDEQGIFPSHRYLAFRIQGTTIQPGENLVFSPLVTVSDYDESGDRIQNYDGNDIYNMTLTADAVPAQDHFVNLCRRTHYPLSLTPNADKLGLDLADYAGRLALVPNATAKFAQKNGDGYVLPRNIFHQLLKGGLTDEGSAGFINGGLHYLRLYPFYNGYSDSHPFILKAAPSNSTNWAIDDILNNPSFPTLQMMHHGNGGSVGSYIYRAGWYLHGHKIASDELFKMRMYTDGTQPLIRSYGVGAKLLWFDESQTEALAAPNGPRQVGGTPYRKHFWDSPDDLVFNQAPIASWNMRANLIMRSPATPSKRVHNHPTVDFRTAWSRAFGSTNGAWALQSYPLVQTSQGGAVEASGSDGYYKKNPFGAPASDLPTQTILFDFADDQRGVLSLGQLRHAPLSQSSFHPSYIVGGSISDIHAPRHQTALDLYDNTSKSKALKILLGAGSSEIGPISGETAGGTSFVDANYDGLFRAGASSPKQNVLGSTMNGDNDIPFYDIVYEVNHNLWDRYFVSGMKMDQAGSAFTVADSDLYWNQRHLFNPSGDLDQKEVIDKLTQGSGNKGLEWGFWHNAAITMIEGQFNVNSTSVNAWKAFLSGNRRLAGALLDGGSDSSPKSKFSRISKPLAFPEETSLETDEGWSGGRGLSDVQISSLANEIVKEVRLRGPFLSLADFVNRRLAEESDASSKLGALDSAIYSASINDSIDTKYGIVSKPADTLDNSSPLLKDLYTATGDNSTLPKSRGYGFPGYLTQGDILESHGFAMSARGDTFTIRTYGESRDSANQVKARAWLEAVVMRTPNYVNASGLESYGGGTDKDNSALDVAQMVDYRTGDLLDGALSPQNKRFGRRFKIISCKWIGAEDDFEL